MKTLCTLIDPYPYSQLTVHEDYKVLAKRLGYAHKFYTVDEFTQGRIDVDTSVALFIFEGALLKISYRTTKDVKRWFPNCKIVALTGESLTYKYGYAHYTNNPTREFEFYDGYDIDLWLDGNDEIVEDYSQKGLTMDYWMWTTSHYLIDQFVNRERLPKTQDSICLIASRNVYRNNMISFMNKKYKCQWGTGADGNYGLDYLYQSFSSSHVVLGTSSPCWWSNRSVKGFRDWIGPICGTVLIYDNYPDAVRKYPCPIYEYEDFGSIGDIIDSLKNNPSEYARLLDTQVSWVKKNTIAIQLYDKLIKHKTISEGD